MELSKYVDDLQEEVRKVMKMVAELEWNSADAARSSNDAPRGVGIQR